MPHGLMEEYREEMLIARAEVARLRLRVSDLQTAVDGQVRARKRDWDMTADQVAADKIRSLEGNVEALRAEIDRMRPVVEAAEDWHMSTYACKGVFRRDLQQAIDAYRAAKGES